MKVIPAVDIHKGRTVRLLQGKASTAKVYYQDPVETAKLLQEQGADIIHIVDLDAAMGKGDNSRIIVKIAEQLNVDLQVGGGIRDIVKAEKFLNANIRRIVLGTAFYKQPQICEKIIEKYGKERVVAAIDHYRGEVKVKGWLESTRMELFDYLKEIESLRPGYILLSSIEGDGTMTGPDIQTIRQVIDKTSTPIIAAGGIGSLNHLKLLSEINLYAVIVGRALYEKSFRIDEAIKTVGGYGDD